MSLPKNLNMINEITNGMTRAKESGSKVFAYQNAHSDELHNQYCFFLKPGVTECHPHPNFQHILEMVLSKICDFDLVIDEVHVLPGPYMERYGIMKQHYGILFNLAQEASRMTEQMQKRFEECYAVSANGVDLLGGFEFIHRFPEVSPVALDFIWCNIAHQRLATGCFAGKIKMGNNCAYVINGFTPRQLSTYVSSNIATVVFMLNGIRPWSEIRSLFVGRSDPVSAASGSIRNVLLTDRLAFGIRDVSIATNGCHLSAGPVEALVELRRFTSDFKCGILRPLDHMSFGRKLVRRFSPAQIDSILANSTLALDDRQCSVFDLTEEVDEDVAIETLASLKSHLNALKENGSGDK